MGHIPVDKTLFQDLYRNFWVVDAREPFEKQKTSLNIWHATRIK
jgi:hypothetical protein